jgi:hypothetical protein
MNPGTNNDGWWNIELLVQQVIDFILFCLF